MTFNEKSLRILCESVSGEVGKVDRKWWLLAAGVGVGFYFGFRFGVVSFRAKRYLSNMPFMKAVIADEKGISADKIQRPRLHSADQVLIEVKASSLDFADFRVARGEWKRVRSFIYRFDPNEVPANAAVLGRSGSGIVVGVGTDVTRVKTGDKVWFFSPPWNQGSMANYVAADSRYVGGMPSNLDFESAATLPFVGLQAFQLIRDNLPGEGKSSVLIWGGWRPLERVAAQIAKSLGHRVSAVATSAANKEKIGKIADCIINADDGGDDIYLEKAKFKRSFDLIINTVDHRGEELTELCKPGGKIVTLRKGEKVFNRGLYSTIITRLWNRFRDLFRRHESFEWFDYETGAAVLDRLRSLVENRRLEAPGPERVFPMEQAEIAFGFLRRGGQQGQLVLRIDPFKKVCPVEEHAMCL